MAIVYDYFTVGNGGQQTYDDQQEWQCLKQIEYRPSSETRGAYYRFEYETLKENVRTESLHTEEEISESSLSKESLEYLNGAASDPYKTETATFQTKEEALDFCMKYNQYENLP